MTTQRMEGFERRLEDTELTVDAMRALTNALVDISRENRQISLENQEMF